MLLALGLQAPDVGSLYASARKYDKDTFRFEPPAPDRADAVRALARALTTEALLGNSAPSSNDRAQARRLGLELANARDAAGPLWVLREAGARRQGDGFFVWRPRGVALCVQAPHSFFDENTGNIALGLFAETHAVALFVNTVHRYAPVVAGVREGAADVAHAARSIFQSATEGLLAARAMPVVQVHGFGPREHLPPGTAAVVSDGTATRAADAPAVRLRAALQGALPGRVLLFGVDAQELGATTNTQALCARQAGAPFLHVEMSQQIRSATPGPARALAQALREALTLAN
jgi:hypothetical protein